MSDSKASHVLLNAASQQTTATALRRPLSDLDPQCNAILGTVVIVLDSFQLRERWVH